MRQVGETPKPRSGARAQPRAQALGKSECESALEGRKTKLNGLENRAQKPGHRPVTTSVEATGVGRLFAKAIHHTTTR